MAAGIVDNRQQSLVQLCQLVQFCVNYDDRVVCCIVQWNSVRSRRWINKIDTQALI